eukprot:TRINITY_DN1522_c0_g4_i1.p2 TRINITY_DN1522_c0_g4~~TRINITY_DN1522_c0_g4_i1.p2  ORF type:complete len:173 (-),score=28.14 TRINITY_DN1522_c0_g4_i1:804-1322(-)
MDERLANSLKDLQLGNFVDLQFRNNRRVQGTVIANDHAASCLIIISEKQQENSHKDNDNILVTFWHSINNLSVISQRSDHWSKFEKEKDFWKTQHGNEHNSNDNDKVSPEQVHARKAKIIAILKASQIPHIVTERQINVMDTVFLDFPFRTARSSNQVVLSRVQTLLSDCLH